MSIISGRTTIASWDYGHTISVLIPVPPEPEVPPFVPPIRIDSDMKKIIKTQGKVCTIYAKTEGSLDAYGDPAPTWTTENLTEKVWIQEARGVKNAEVLKTIAGNIDTSTYVGYLLPDTLIVEGRILEDEDGNRYKVNRVIEAWVYTLSHKEAHLTLLREG